MKRFSLSVFLLAGILLLSGCMSQQKRELLLREEEPGTIQDWNWIILDYRNRDRGEFIPDWVYYYYEGNFSAIENLPGFRDKYVFISGNTGTNFNALLQWNEAFPTDLDFARLAAIRIEKRFLASAVTYPDDEYGSYFEALIRAASDAQWVGAQRED